MNVKIDIKDIVCAYIPQMIVDSFFYCITNRISSLQY